MPDSYAGNPDNFPSTITRPVGTDRANAASVRTPFAELADRTANLESTTSSQIADLSLAMGSQTVRSLATVFGSDTTGSYVLIDLLTLAGVVVGDKIEAWIGPILLYAATGYSGTLRVRFAENSVPVADFFVPISDVPRALTFPFARTVVNSGTLTIQLHIKADTAGHAASWELLLQNPSTELQWGVAKVCRPPTL
jgi:hypothetical protein